MDRFKRLTVKHMKEELSRLGINTSGNKQQLIDKYEEALLKINGGEGTSRGKRNNFSDDDDESDDSDVYGQNKTFLFKDIEDSVSKFSGDDNFTIGKWQMKMNLVNEFEETSLLLGWDNLQKFIYSKRLMTGTAKLFLRSCSAKSWSSLKKLLLKEFNVKVSSGEVHRMLMKAKMKTDESIHQYILRMKEIAALAEIDDTVIIEYIIDGVNLDDNCKKFS